MSRLTRMISLAALLALAACGYAEKFGRGVDSSVQGTIDHLSEGG